MKHNASLICLLFTLGLSSCATQTVTQKPLEIAPPRLPAVPAEVMVAREPNFRQRLLNFFLASPQKPTP